MSSWSSWIEPGTSPEYGVHALPYGLFTRGENDRRRLGVRVGDSVLDLAAAVEAADVSGAAAQLLGAESLDPLLAAGPDAWAQVRATVAGWVRDEAHQAALTPHLHPVAEVRMHLPFTVADYVDFYSSRHHAENLGALFRPGQPALTPNWLHLPIGYHGRSGTVVVSGTEIRRPAGQRKEPDEAAPTFGPSLRLDIEAEVGFVVGTPSELGSPVPGSAFAEHVFGVVLVNDWSARDLQAWEYVPLGPFLGKSFATSISAWVLPLPALEQARVAPPEREVALTDYLVIEQPWGLDLSIEVELNGTVISRPPFAGMYWTPAQQLAHLTVNGASLRTGDLYASGTVSGPGSAERGSLIELSWNGAQPITLSGGATRSFLDDGDEVVLRASAPGPDGAALGLGEVRGRIVPA